MRSNFRVLAAAAVLAAAVLSGGVGQILAHCEIPCGIYDDDARFAAMLEDIATIEKSMAEIEKLLSDPGQKLTIYEGPKGAPLLPGTSYAGGYREVGKVLNVNQITRWINNKETHADRISETVTQYFLTQRIKVPSAGDAAAEDLYSKRLTLLHQMMVAAMKCKQTTDLAHVKTLHDLLHAFEDAYKQ